MGSFGPGLGSVVVSHQHVNTQILNSHDYSTMMLRIEHFGFKPSSGKLNYQIMVNTVNSKDIKP